MDVVSETEQYITVVDLRRSDRWYERRRFDCVDKEHFNKTKIRFLDYYNNRLVVADLGKATL